MQPPRCLESSPLPERAGAFFSGAGLSAIAARLAAGERVRSSSDDLASSWADFLERFSFQWFCSFTFQTSVHPEAADKKWRVWIAKLNRELYGPRWYRRPYSQVFWCRALEWQKRGVLHYHALVGDAVDVNTKALRYVYAAEWEQLAGYCDIQTINSDSAVRAYCAKYVGKGGELDLSPSLRWYLQPVREVVVG